MNFKKWIFIAILLVIFYYAFIENFFLTLSIIASFYVLFKIYKFYARKKLNKLVQSKELFRQSQLGHFIALVAKVAKADGRVDELEAQLISMMFDDISKVFDEKEKARAIMKEIFNEEKQKDDDTKQIAQSLNQLLGRGIHKRKQFVGFLIQLAFIDNGISQDEDKVLRVIIKELEISDEIYEAIINNFKNKMKNNQQTMSQDEAYKILEVKETDDMNTIKKAYRKLIRQYHPDIISSQDKDEAYIEEATAKTQEINQAYQLIKDIKGK
ncbi:DnaJ domain-containing protein [Arcobacter sp. YIC-80]|uniref:DnaJ domain-containing protein n=1 Tax=unclassified Arcobacter TaxID=2593671 RepID=UPI00384EFD44